MKFSNLAITYFREHPIARTLEKLKNDHIKVFEYLFEHIGTEQRHDWPEIVSRKDATHTGAYRNPSSNIQSEGAHPGLSKTNLYQYYPSLISSLGNHFLQPSAKGALPILYAALDIDLKCGAFIGPDGFQQMRGYPSQVKAD